MLAVSSLISLTAEGEIMLIILAGVTVIGFVFCMSFAFCNISAKGNVYCPDCGSEEYEIEFEDNGRILYTCSCGKSFYVPVAAGQGTSRAG